MPNLRLFVMLFFLMTAVACQQSQPPDSDSSAHTSPSYKLHKDFGSYWYAGVAEISSYKLKQVRYGEYHNGSAVLIFVTEPFSLAKQVKLDNPDGAANDKQTVLKLNFTKKFNTGIYPYSMMLSSFVPVERQTYPHTPKVTMSSQEWCGHMFAQLNHRQDHYLLSSYSYFESEGDVVKELPTAILEDELWNLIRLDYTTLPTGSVMVMPGLFHTRLRHKNLSPIEAQGRLTAHEDTMRYMLSYQDESRTLSIDFEKDFPNKILKWTETIDGSKGERMTTTAELDRTILSDYWSKNRPEDSHLRDSLNLE